MGFQLRHPRDRRVHFSMAKKMSLSAAHARAAALEPDEPSDAMAFGTLVDAIVMPTGRKIATFGGAVRRGKEWDAFREANAGAMIVKREELDEAMRCAESVLRNPVVNELKLFDGMHQEVVQWDMFGLPWAAGIEGERGGFDVLSVAGRFINDLKTTTNTSPAQLSRQIRKMLYPEQLAAYRFGAESKGYKIENCYLTCVERTAPYAVTVVRVPNQDLEDALHEVELWCSRIRRCEELDHWPAYVNEVVDLEPRMGWEE